MTATPPRTRAAGRFRQHLPARTRLFLSAAAGIAVAVTARRSLSPTLRAVIGWDTTIVLFLALILIMVVRASPQTVRRRAKREDQARWAFLVLMAGSGFFSMFAILGLMHEAHGAKAGVSAALAVLAGITILFSWIFVHTVFAVHYAHEYYGSLETRGKPGLTFPGERTEFDYWDFLYFSFVIGMTCQVSDVQVMTRGWRRLVLVHGILSFLFNTIILALSINLLASLL